jgi:kynurenine formamidase
VRLSDPETFVNLDSSGTLHWPGFGAEAAEFLVNERGAVNIGVDTLGLDFRASEDFGTHLSVLPAGKYGLDNLANLQEGSPSGTTITVGAPKLEGATGGSARVFAVTGELG